MSDELRAQLSLLSERLHEILLRLADLLEATPKRGL